jgi:hypothetical protein
MSQFLSMFTTVAYKTSRVTHLGNLRMDLILNFKDDSFSMEPLTSQVTFSGPQSVDPATIAITRITVTSADVSWEPVTGNLDYYILNTSPSVISGRNKLVRGTQAALKGLIPGMYYTVTITTKVGSMRSKQSTASFRTSFLCE